MSHFNGIHLNHFSFSFAYAYRFFTKIGIHWCDLISLWPCQNRSKSTHKYTQNMLCVYNFGDGMHIFSLNHSNPMTASPSMKTATQIILVLDIKCDGIILHQSILGRAEWENSLFFAIWPTDDQKWMYLLVSLSISSRNYVYLCMSYTQLWMKTKNNVLFLFKMNTLTDKRCRWRQQQQPIGKETIRNNMTESEEKKLHI